MKDILEQREAKEMPLEGIRIVEYAIFHAGPGGVAILGDLGAEVIKVESWNGDPERYWTKVGPIDQSLKNGESFWFQVSNRNKKGIYIDIQKEKGLEILYRLIEDADVFVTNLRKSTKVTLGIDYDTISKVNPRIIYAAVSGYGPNGPMSDLGAFDPLGSARSGLMFATGSKVPLIMHGGVLDQATAIAVSHGILTALLVRERKGIGQEIHISLYGTGLWLMQGNLMFANLLSQSPSQIPFNRYEHPPLRNAFCCKDKKWIMGTHHPEQPYWPSFCEATGQTALMNDPRFADEAAREENCVELIRIFDQVFATKTRDEWNDILQEKKLMFTSVQDIIEVQNDPQAIMNDYVVDYEDSLVGKVKIPGYPIHFSANHAGTRRLAPTMGEHTDLVMQEAGYADEEISNLRKEGVIK
jgi:crotonobetainyl-CoA:carnitine CoA-transferase CaiB-like acyl-CoA transferase